MKIKQNLYISHPDDFLKGDYDTCFAVIGGRWMDDDWTYCGEIEIDVKVDSGEVISQVTEQIKATIKEEEGKYEAKMNALHGRLYELLALESS